MRILQVCARIPYPVEDGGSAYVFNTTKHLAKVGHEVHLASFYSELHKQETKGIEAFCNLYSEKGNFKAYSVLSVIKSTISRIPISIQHRMSTRIMGKILSKVPNNIDVILLEGLHTAEFIPQLRTQYSTVPIILRHVNVEHELIYRNASTESNILKKLFLFDQSSIMKKFELKSLNAVDRVTFISNVDAGKLIPLIRSTEPTLINPPGSDIKEPINFDKRESNKLVAFSNWKWAPNANGLNWFLKKIWPLVIEKKPGIELHLAGINLPSKVQNKLPKGVKYHGFIDDLYEFNESSTIQVIPLISGSGVKLKMVEGLAYGNPIVSTSFGADGLNAVNGEHYELANTPKEFCDKILSLLDDKEHRKKLSINSQKLISENYSWEKTIKDLDHFLETIVQSN